MKTIIKVLCLTFALGFSVMNSVASNNIHKRDTVKTYYENGKIKENYVIMKVDTIEVYDSINKWYYEYVYEFLNGKFYYKNGHIKLEFWLSPDEKIYIMKHFKESGLLNDEVIYYNKKVVYRKVYYKPFFILREFEL